MKKYQVEIKENEDSTVEIKGEIPSEEFESHRSEAIKSLGKDANIAGFRKGHVPEKVLVEKIGEPVLLQEMAEIALSKAYPLILIQEEIDAISSPDIQITKMASKNPLGFSIKTAVMPKITLPNYKDIAGKAIKDVGNKTETTEQEVDESLLKIKRSLASKDKTPEESAQLKNEDLPELTDEDVKKFGDYKNLGDFKEKLKQSLEVEKDRQHKEKIRLGIIEGIIKDSKIALPEILIREELSRMFAQFKNDIERMGLKPEEYLISLKKTEDDLKNEWREDARKRVASELILSEISKKEEIEATDEEVEKETEHLLSHYPKADKERIRAYVAHTLTNTKVFEFLENQK